MKKNHSRIEQKAIKHSVVASERREISLPHTFYDKKGKAFKAKVDGQLTDDIYLEYKDHQLNNKTSIDSSSKALADQLKWRFPIYQNGDEPIPENHNKASSILWRSGFHTDCLKHGWCHSAYKQAIVSQGLAEAGQRLIIIFNDHPATMPLRGRQVPFQYYYTIKHGLETYTFKQWVEIVRPEILARQ